MMKRTVDNFRVIGSNYQVPITHDAPPPNELKIRGVEKQTIQTHRELVHSQLRPDDLSDNALVELLNGRHPYDAMSGDEYPSDE
jgi:hypothetical protein